jgi:hypothetical protein
MRTILTTSSMGIHAHVRHRGGGLAAVIALNVVPAVLLLERHDIRCRTLHHEVR